MKLLGDILMADDTQEKKDQPKAKLPLKTLIIIAAVLVLEGGLISMFWILKGGPAPAEATDPITQTEQNVNNNFAEVVMAKDFQVDNYMAGRTRMIVTIEVAAKVEGVNKEKLQKEVDEHSKEILNCIRILISSAQPDQIKDPRLEVIKRGIQKGVEEIVGEGIIQEILLPVWQTYITD